MGANTGAIRAGRAYVELGLDQSKFVKGLRAAEKELKALGQSIMKIGAGLTAAGGAITGVFTAAAKSFVSAGDAINDMATRTGVSVGALQALGFAAKMSGTDVEALETGLRVMQRTITDAAGGSKSAAKSLTDVGLSVQALAGMAPEDQFTAVAEAISKIEDPTRRVAVAFDLLGRGGTSLIPMMEEGAAGIAAMAQRFAQLGPPLTAADVSLAALADDVWNELLTAFKAITNQVGASVTPALVELGQIATELIADGARWASRNRELLATIAKVGAAAAVAGGAIVALGASVSVAGFVLGGVATAVTFVGSAIAALASPIGLAVVGVTAATAAFVKFTDTGRAMADTVTTALGEVIAKAKEIGGAVFNAVASGDLQLAGELIKTTFELAWAHVKQTAMEVWFAIKNTVLDAVNAIIVAYENMVDAATRAMLRLESNAKRWVQIKDVQLTKVYQADQIRGMEKKGKADPKSAADALRTLDAMEAAGIAEINKRYDDQIDALMALAKQEHDSTVEELRNTEEHDARLKEQDATTQALQTQIEKLNEQLRKSIALAGQEAPLLAAQALGPDPDWNIAMGSGTDAAAQLVRQSTSGTFSAAGVAGLGVNTTLEKIRNAAEETARHMRRLLDNPPGRVPLNFA